MKCDKSRVKPNYTTFKGIIPGKEARCNGKITIDVVFGTPNNYLLEELTFDIITFRSGYHALLGCDTFTKFHAIPHNAYMKLKMLGPSGVINIASNFDRAPKAENKASLVTIESLEAFVAKELTAPRATVDRNNVILDKRSKPMSFKPDDEIIQFQVHPQTPTNRWPSAHSLTQLWMRHYICFSEKIGTSLLPPFRHARNSQTLCQAQPEYQRGL